LIEVKNRIPGAHLQTGNGSACSWYGSDSGTPYAGSFSGHPGCDKSLFIALTRRQRSISAGKIAIGSGANIRMNYFA
jgi:hypothetical protein